MPKCMRIIAVNFISIDKIMSQLLGDIEKHSLLTLESWEKMEQRPFSAQIEAKKFTFNVMEKQMMSFNHGEPETNDLMKDYFTFMKGATSVPINPPRSSYRKALKSKSKDTGLCEKDHGRKTSRHTLRRPPQHCHG